MSSSSSSSSSISFVLLSKEINMSALDIYSYSMSMLITFTIFVPTELAASLPSTEIVGKSDYFRFGMRDSLAIEASFLQVIYWLRSWLVECLILPLCNYPRWLPKVLILWQLNHLSAIITDFILFSTFSCLIY